MVRKWSVPYPGVNGEQQRDAYLYLPVDYDQEQDRRYPVLYMFDGQNVFLGPGRHLRQELGDGEVPRTKTMCP